MGNQWHNNRSKNKEKITDTSSYPVMCVRHEIRFEGYGGNI